MYSVPISEDPWTYVKQQKQHISTARAYATKTYCKECSCPGFPYCLLGRMYPKNKLESDQVKKRVNEGEKICLNCGCTSCLYGKLDKWSSCKYCRRWYLSDLHCRCSTPPPPQLLSKLKSFQVSCMVDSRPCPISPTEIQREDLQRIQIENE